MRIEGGFSLIELMVVVAIIGVLALVSLPLYRSYLQKSVDQSCLWEAKSYANLVFLSLNDNDDDTSPPEPANKACKETVDATGWTQIEELITAKPLSPSTHTVVCNIANGAPCKII